ncbi:MAG: tRNA (5-methylaminomethyl-2-thiouridine)(34)-methyltransferase MnmD [Bacteroidetes bacterium]|nr:tRNA (5-methylaminomethyl-2-thiouridine)(34)-methyltransferase MnmD [Bacteroidota bacterium]MBL6944210.1 tRNA (5-methylaminomethyl-2-thiouridine)(34)-methyltransferase MnmD [Bacteroidales bacterium]
MIKNRLLLTDDGSHTIFSEKFGENYHSGFGAIQESKHIFIDAGLNTVIDKNLTDLRILEVGSGTGLNMLLAYLWSEENNISVTYYGLEPFPICKNEALLLNYPNQLGIDKNLFLDIHNDIGNSKKLSGKFLFQVNSDLIEDANLPDSYYNVVFFDAFSPDAQPEVWTPDIFINIYKSMVADSVLTTYSCKGIVKRALKEAGFRIEKLPGPPGKREFLRAWKL